MRVCAQKQQKQLHVVWNCFFFVKPAGLIEEHLYSLPEVSRVSLNRVNEFFQ